MQSQQSSRQRQRPQQSPPGDAAVPAAAGALSSDADLRQRLQHTFGNQASAVAPLAGGGAGVRLTGIDLCRPLEPQQVALLLDLLSQYRIMCVAGQDLQQFSLAHLERFANHWGAPVPHPSNFLRGGKPALEDGASGGEVELIPFAQRRAAAANAVFPDQLQCLPHESPAILVVANFGAAHQAGAPVVVSPGGSWHTDIEYEPLPIYVSMFLAHVMPTARDSGGGTWVQAPTPAPLDARATPYFGDSDPELMRLRMQLPLNGETAYADTAAAYAALPAEQQRQLDGVRVRRRLNQGDPGWLAPLVRTNPRSGIKSLHSPIWASRPRVRPPVEVDGMSSDRSRAFLDQLEAHVLQPQFRYDHLHEPGDVTIWDNYMTVHNTPFVKTNIDSLADARLLYRVSCKGEPAVTLPRTDPAPWLEQHINIGYATPRSIVSMADG